MVVVASGKTGEDKGRGERLALIQGVGRGDYNYRGKLAVGWHRLLLYCEGKVHIEGKIVSILLMNWKRGIVNIPLTIPYLESRLFLCEKEASVAINTGPQSSLNLR